MSAATHRRPGTLDLDQYEPGKANPATKYGLPPTVQYCQSCVISNQRPNSVVEYQHVKDSQKPTLKMFDDGVCSACRVWESKHDAIDWDARKEELREICDRHRRSDGRYDCIVPGSGGKDSFYASWVLKHEFGMQPLTITWAPNLYTPWGWHNFQAWTQAGFDNVLVTPSGTTHRLLTRLAVENLYHPFQPFIIGQKMLAAKLSVLHGIPLVFYGDTAAEHGQPPEEEVSGQLEWDYFISQGDAGSHIGGVSLEQLYGDYGLKPNDLHLYLPLDPEQVRAAGTTACYLGYYLNWHPQGAYYLTVDNSKWSPAPERTPGTYNKFQSLDDKIDDLHYYTTFIKFGIGRASYEASVDVRARDLTREEAVALVKRYDGEWPTRFQDELYEYLSVPQKEFPEAFGQFEQPIMDHDYFMDLTDHARSPHLWKQEGGRWKLRHTVDGIDLDQLERDPRAEQAA